MDRWKFDILDNFALRDENMEFELESSRERVESIIGLV